MSSEHNLVVHLEQNLVVHLEQHMASLLEHNLVNHHEFVVAYVETHNVLGKLLHI
jgi:hypothetical protein